jgi:hypothetical protein
MDNSIGAISNSMSNAYSGSGLSSASGNSQSIEFGRDFKVSQALGFADTLGSSSNSGAYTSQFDFGPQSSGSLIGGGTGSGSTTNADAQGQITDGNGGTSATAQAKAGNGSSSVDVGSGVTDDKGSGIATNSGSAASPNSAATVAGGKAQGYEQFAKLLQGGNADVQEGNGQNSAFSQALSTLGLSK